ncbi:PREDICTED: uncharacterized protein LOC108381957, partial [Rhagoletis zephyria]|uniref:uncharacterized protein LOC108381957 n=1 Tax=Rhagoletis zephyria TaxID=28612 RepID=UPI0008112E8A
MSRSYTSPYAKPIQQYPSQSEDYISLEVGGPGKCSTPARAQYNSLNTKGGGNFYQNRQNGRENQQNRFSVGWTNNRHSAGGYAGQRQQHTPRSIDTAEWQWRGGGNNRPRNNRPSFTNKVNDISAFVHPSMLEDPWNDLMKRREAIKRSEIQLSTPAKQNEERSCMDNIAVK